MSNVIVASFGALREARTRSLWQYDYGQRLKFSGIQLPDNYEVHFSNVYNGNATTQIGNADGVTIPDIYLTTGLPVFAWVFVHTGESDGETEYIVTIPVKQRAQPSDDPPSPVEQSVITQTIAALNAGVERAETAQNAAEAAQQSSEEYANNAHNSASESAQSASDAGAYAVRSENAQRAAASAQSGAETAQANAEQAQRLAESFAVSAERSADRAEQVANTAGYLDVEIVDGRLIYTRTDAVDVDFELLSGHLIMEVI